MERSFRPAQSEKNRLNRPVRNPTPGPDRPVVGTGSISDRHLTPFNTNFIILFSTSIRAHPKSIIQSIIATKSLVHLVTTQWTNNINTYITSSGRITNRFYSSSPSMVLFFHIVPALFFSLAFIFVTTSYIVFNVHYEYSDFFLLLLPSFIFFSVSCCSKCFSIVFSFLFPL